MENTLISIDNINLINSGSGHSPHSYDYEALYRPLVASRLCLESVVIGAEYDCLNRRRYTGVLVLLINKRYFMPIEWSSAASCEPVGR